MDQSYYTALDFKDNVEENVTQINESEYDLLHSPPRKVGKNKKSKSSFYDIPSSKLNFRLAGQPAQGKKWKNSDPLPQDNGSNVKPSQKHLYDIPSNKSVTSTVAKETVAKDSKPSSPHKPEMAAVDKIEEEELFYENTFSVLKAAQKKMRGSFYDRPCNLPRSLVSDDQTVDEVDSESQAPVYDFPCNSLTACKNEGSCVHTKRPVSALEFMQDQLPGLEDFLSNILAQESLSTKAEEKRKYFVERFEVLKFLSPPLPPRPEGLPKPSDILASGSDEINDDYLRKQREWSRMSQTSARSSSSLPKDALSRTNKMDNGIDREEYDFVDDALDFRGINHSESAPGAIDEDLYEEPQGMQLDGDENGDGYSSGTSYESYEDQEPDKDRGPPIYENQDFHASSSDISLPRINPQPEEPRVKSEKRSQRKKKKVPTATLR